ncbi:hypothetical protein D3C87_620990 [compost metagenome]|uniref:hypothetical protein n=1 Tax=Pedobacter sp. ok626 TaxID=1761882 RepID=UPI000889B5ED|nr:hypothetical protein [Pedobacter sp. ok626]SDL15351.1 hypothetical protein SAMN04487898_115134 [Pedobacter sp. ok626]
MIVHNISSSSKAALYFLFSVVLTGIFINQKFWLYSSVNAMIISGSIAGTKWLIQIIAALVFLKDKKWDFIHRIGFVCFMGSVVLFVYYVFNFLPFPFGGFSQFVLAIALAVLVMIFGYYQAVKKTGLSAKWFWAWMLCLAIAIFLQVTVVF